MSLSERNSTFELMRLVAMFVIVFYHILCAYLDIYSDSAYYNFVNSLLPLVHFGVILFVLISGFFGIRASIGGFLKLFGILFIYYIPLELAYVIFKNVDNSLSLCESLKRLALFSYTPYWFIRSYLILYILSPMVNMFLHNITNRQKLIFVAIIGFISCIIGNVTPWNGLEDISLIGGKNILNFIFLYTVGNLLNGTYNMWNECKLSILIGLFVILSFIMFVLTFYIFPRGSAFYDFIFSIVFAYNGFIQILYGILVFIILGHLNLKSKYINKLSVSVFAIYLIHCHPLFIKFVLNNSINHAVNLSGGGIYQLLGIFILFSIGIMIGCILVDKSLSFLWRKWNFVCNKVNTYINNSSLKI